MNLLAKLALERIAKEESRFDLRMMHIMDAVEGRRKGGSSSFRELEEKLLKSAYPDVKIEQPQLKRNRRQANA